MKPTTVLAFRLPTMGRNIERCNVSVATPWITLEGHDVDGKYKTFEAKGYPNAICRAIALTIGDYVSHHGHDKCDAGDTG